MKLSLMFSIWKAEEWALPCHKLNIHVVVSQVTVSGLLPTFREPSWGALSCPGFCRFSWQSHHPPLPPCAHRSREKHWCSLWLFTAPHHEHVWWRSKEVVSLNVCSLNVLMYAANKVFGSEMPKKALFLSNAIIGQVAYSLYIGYYVLGEVGSGVRMTTCMQDCSKILLSEWISAPEVVNGGVVAGCF